MVEESWGSRWLGWTGVDEPDAVSGKLRSIRRLVLVTIACEGWYVLGFVPYSSRPFKYTLVALVLLACAIAN